jgi:hypothetical protein
MDYQDEKKARTQHVNAVIRDYMPTDAVFQKTLLEAMRYSIDAGGKREIDEPITASEGERRHGTLSRQLTKTAWHQCTAGQIGT